MTPAAKQQQRERADAQGRGPGRPRSSEVHQAILAATIGQLVERGGYTALSIEAVAAQAGSSKAAIYRRWPSKLELTIEALTTFAPDLEPPDTGSARGDYLALTTELQSGANFRRSATLLPRLLADAADIPELFAALRTSFIDPRRALLRDALARGVERGELRDGLDFELLIDSLIGPLVYRILTTAADVKAVRGMPEQLWDALAPAITPSTGRRSR